MTSKLLSGFVSILLGKVGVILIGVVVTPILVRLLGSEQYGAYAFVLSAHAILVTITSSGIFNGLRKYIAEDRSRSGWQGYVFGFYVQVGFLVTVAIAALIGLLAYAGVLTSVFEGIDLVLFYLLGLMLIADVAYKIGRGTLMGLHLESLSEPLQVARKLTFAFVAIGLLYVGFGAEGALLAQIIGMGMAFFGAIVLLSSRLSFRDIASSYVGDPNTGDFLSFNIQSILLALLTTSLYTVDILILQPFAGSETTGHYKAALVVAEFLWFAPIALQYALVQSTSRMWVNEERDRITRISSQVTRYTLLFGLLLVLGLAALAEPFLSLYFGPEFAVASTPLLLLLPGVLGFAVARPIFAIGQGKGDLKLLNLATGLAAVINLALNFMLIPRYGMIGAAIATSVGYGTMVCFHVWAARQIGFNPIADVRLLRTTATGVVGGTGIFTLTAVFQSDILALLLVPPLGFLLYVSVARLTGAIDETDVAELVERAPISVGLYSWRT